MGEPIEEVRRISIALLESNEYLFTDTALKDGMRLARTLGDICRGFPSQCGLVDYIVEQLKLPFPLNAAPLGEPPGSSGVAYTMNNTNGQGLCIKLKVEDDRVVIMSFHVSKHYRGT
jgi:hypothetical protein